MIMFVNFINLLSGFKMSKAIPSFSNLTIVVIVFACWVGLTASARGGDAEEVLSKTMVRQPKFALRYTYQVVNNAACSSPTCTIPIQMEPLGRGEILEIHGFSCRVSVTSGTVLSDVAMVIGSGFSQLVSANEIRASDENGTNFVATGRNRFFVHQDDTLNAVISSTSGGVANAICIVSGELITKWPKGRK